MLPLLDYADGVWDNCTINLADELEQLHLDAIRTITGAVRGISHQDYKIIKNQDSQLYRKDAVVTKLYIFVS